MKVALTYIFVLMLVVSCINSTNDNDVNQQTVLTYDYYSPDTTKRRSIQVIRSKEYTSKIKVRVLEKGNEVLTYSERVTESGIYRYCKDSVYESHSFLQDKYIENCLPKRPPFLNGQIVLSDTKTYEVKDKSILIISFNEINSAHDVIVTYYIRDLGFICYYDLRKRSYWLLSDYKGFSFEKNDYNKIKEKFVNDTLFFAGERIKRLKPPPPPE